MVPRKYYHHNVTKLLKYLEISLNHIGRLFSFIGYPFYFIIYRIFIYFYETYRKLLVYAEKRELKKVIIDNSAENRSKIEQKLQHAFDELTINIHRIWKLFLEDVESVSSYIIQKVEQSENEINRITSKKELLKLLADLFHSLKKQTSPYIKDVSFLVTSPITFFEKINSYLSNIYRKYKYGYINFLKSQKVNRKRLNKKYQIFSKTFIRKEKELTKQLMTLAEITRKHLQIKKRIYKNKKELFLKLNKYYFSLRKKLAKRQQRFLSKVRKLRGRKIKWAAYFFTVLVIVLAASGITMWFTIIKDLPSSQVLAARSVKASTKIYDRNGLLLYKIYKDENRTPVDLTEIPKHVIQATLAIEDSEFYTHPGFSVRGMTRAIIRNYQRGELTGGSTITQQLVKNTLLTPEKTITRKLKEVFLAVDVEMNYSKDEILEMYLNEVSYGGTAYGIQEASKQYFDKNVQELTLAEAAILAGLPRSPTDYSPFGSNPQSSVNRRLEVLRLMEDNGYITHEQRLAAQKEKIVFNTPEVDIKAPHFVMYVREKLEKKYGKEVVEQGGLEVYTTLDYETQLAAEQAVRDEIENLSRLNVGNGAALVLSPSSGEILAMVGSKNYFEYDNDGNVNVTTSLRQPGSSIKLVNYAYALSNGYTPATILDDSAQTFVLAGSPPYQPKNYDGRFRGRISLRSAFAESRNIPAVKVLDSYGVQNMIELGKKMGITTWEEKNRFGLSLTLGGGEVMLTELAQVYATVANYGNRPNLTSVLKVTDYKGRVLEVNECDKEKRSTLVAIADKLSTEVSASQSAVRLPFQDTNCSGEKVLDPRVAFMITDILKDNDARTPAFGRNSLLNISGHPEVAVKTGTSNNLRDNLTVGYNQNYLVAVWVGNNDNTPMSRVASGVTGASPIFNKIMTYLVKDQPSNEWIVPNGLVKLDICPYTGTLSCSGCPTRSEWFLEENKPEQRCRIDWFENNNNRDQNKDENGDNNDRRNNRIPDWVRERLNN